LNFSIGFSPCPNDTFIFDALINQKIDTEGFKFDAVLEDVETLNQWTLQGKLVITKLSFPAFFRSLDTYILLNAGSALGKGVGPLLVSKETTGAHLSEVDTALIALPGINTTANLLFSFAYPGATNKKFMIFSAIEDAVVNGEAALGVIIHENRFTYQHKGLHKIVDLGEHWEEKMQTPIPLGGIAIKRTIENETRLKINRLIRKSLEYAFANYPLITEYVKQHSQSMSEDVMRKHIDLYVNDFSLDLGKEGKEAITVLQEIFSRQESPKKNSPFTGNLFIS
jgi:1,4-dihydroxy-6-naphthoate synthase